MLLRYEVRPKGCLKQIYLNSVTFINKIVSDSFYFVDLYRCLDISYFVCGHLCLCIIRMHFTVDTWQTLIPYCSRFKRVILVQPAQKHYNCFAITCVENVCFRFSLWTDMIEDYVITQLCARMTGDLLILLIITFK